MAATVTLAQLRERSRLYADERPGSTDSYLTTAEANQLVNQSIKELYDRLVAARGHEYYIAFDSFDTVVGDQFYPLPDDFYEMLTVKLNWAATDVEELDQMAYSEMIHLGNVSTWGRWTPKGYRVVQELFLAPSPTGIVQVELIYLPGFGELTLDSDTFDGVNGWEKSVCLRTAIEMRTIQQEDTSDLERLYEREVARIEGLAADRAALTPKTVRDVYPEGSPRRWPERLPRP
jgi:hypothetical protein